MIEDATKFHACEGAERGGFCNALPTLVKGAATRLGLVHMPNLVTASVNAARPCSARVCQISLRPLLLPSGAVQQLANTVEEAMQSIEPVADGNHTPTEALQVRLSCRAQCPSTPVLCRRA